MPVIDLRDVGFAYGSGDTRREVLRGVDLRLEDGELVALLGANGSGKTTVLRLIAGELRPDTGSVELFGSPAHSWSRKEIARRIAVLPQAVELPAGFRVAEVVAMGRIPHAERLFGAGADDERAVEQALIDADAEDLAERRVTELSGGERQRVLVALALAQEPRVLLLDEPTVHLDLSHQVALLDTLRRLRARRDLTVVVVLHDLNMALAFAPRTALLDGGRIMTDGPTADVLTPDAARRIFGVSVTEAHAATGQRALLHLAGDPPSA